MGEQARVGIDQAGYVQQMPTEPLPRAYASLLAEVCAQLWALFPALIHSAYVYGSVARGTARLGVSDLDLTLILWQTPSAEEREALLRLQRCLAHRHPAVSKIDFDVGVVAEVLAPESALRWGGWLKHYCRHLKGDDLSLLFPVLPPTRALALALNGDCVSVLQDYVTQLEAATDDAAARRLQREAARQLLRATMVLRSDEDDAWPVTLVEMVAWASKHFPEQAQAWRYFEGQTQSSAADKNVFLAHLRAYLLWLGKRL